MPKRNPLVRQPSRQKSHSARIILEGGFGHLWIQVYRSRKDLSKSHYIILAKSQKTLSTPVEKKCLPWKDLARFSFKVLQDNAFFCKTSCKNLARKKFPCKILPRRKISWNVLDNFFYFLYSLFDFKLTTAS